MGRYILNSLTLKQMGIRMLPEEKLEVAVELEGGLTEELENSHSTLLLTSKRLVRYSASGHKNNVITAALDNVDSIEVNKTHRNKQWIWVGLVFILGGLLLGLLSLLLVSSPVSPLLMAFSLFLIGVVFMLAYVGGDSGEVIVHAGIKDIKCKMRPKALDDMAIFVQRVYELKLGYEHGVLEEETSFDTPDEEVQIPDEDETSELETVETELVSSDDKP